MSALSPLQWYMKYRNDIIMGVSLFVSCNVAYYYYVDNSTLHISIPIVFAQFVVDLIECDNVMRLHHIFGILAILPQYMYDLVTPTNIDTFKAIVLVLYKMEISTIFLMMKIDKAKYAIVPAGINNALFFLTFFKFRIYDYLAVMFDPTIHSNMYETFLNKPYAGIMLYVSMCGYMCINMYWFSIICKLSCKSFLAQWQKNALSIWSEWVLQYTYFVNIGVAYYTYSFLPSYVHGFDMIGVSGLSIASYYYHNAVSIFLLKNEKYEYTAVELYTPYFSDRLGIHVRSFMCLLTNAYPVYNNTSIVASAVTHLATYLSSVAYYHYMKHKHDRIYADNTPTSKQYFQIMNILISVPCLFDMAMAMISSCLNNGDCITHNIKLLAITIVIGVILMVRPFYEVNHVVFHMALMIHTYMLCLTNIR